MKVQKEFVLREIAGDYVIIPTGKTVLSFNGLITVNEVGADLWKMLQSEVTFDDLLHGLLESYDVDEETAREDIQEFLDTLIEGGVLDDFTRNYTRNLTYVWCIFLFINLSISIATVFMPAKIWALYNACISYIALGVMFGVEYIVRIILRARHKKHARY